MKINFVNIDKRAYDLLCESCCLRYGGSQKGLVTSGKRTSVVNGFSAPQRLHSCTVFHVPMILCKNEY